MRDQDRHRGLNGQNTVQDEACEYIWRELVGEFLPDSKSCGSDTVNVHAQQIGNAGHS